MNFNKYWILAFRILVAFSILYFIYSKFPFSGVIKALTSADIILVIICALLTFISYIVASYRLLHLVLNQGVKINFLKIFEINLATLFYGLFLPGGNFSGGAVRVYKISGEDRKVMETLASITFDRVLATLSLFIVGIFFWIIHRPINSAFIVSVMLTGAVLIIVLHICVMTDRISFVFKILNVIKISFVSRTINKFYSILNNYRKLSVSRLLILLTFSIFSQLIGILVYYLLAKSLDIYLPYTSMGWVRSAVILATMIPVSVSGFGLREGALLYLMHSYGILPDKILALSLLVYFVTIFTLGLFGGLIEGVRTLIPKNNQ